jgi:hypothetical protein
MTLAAFQTALCDLTASPQLSLLARLEPANVFAAYDLTPRELMRLISVVQQRGMSTNCTLYRVNRITPLYTMLPNTSFLLGDELVTWADRFWLTQKADLQFGPEVEKFGAFLLEQISLGALQNEYLEEVMNFEMSVNELLFVSKKDVKDRLRDPLEFGLDSKVQLHPLIRVVRFSHEPTTVLSRLALPELPPADLPTSEYYLLLDAHRDLLVKKVAPELGHLLQRIDSKEELQLSTVDIKALITAGLVVLTSGSCVEAVSYPA